MSDKNGELNSDEETIMKAAFDTAKCLENALVLEDMKCLLRRDGGKSGELNEGICPPQQRKSGLIWLR